MARRRSSRPGVKAQGRKEYKERGVQIAVSKHLKEAGDRPGHGTGTRADDVWHPEEHTSEGESVSDGRRDKVLCSACSEEVRHVEVDGQWFVRNLDDALPHALSCAGEED